MENLQEIDLHFPFAGIDVSLAVGKQPNRPAAEGKYARTTISGTNVRAYDAGGRARGGNRSGLVKYLEARPNDVEYVTQHLAKIVITVDSPVQPSQSGRKVILVAVSGGNVYTNIAGEDDWNTPSNNANTNPPLIITGLMQSAVLNQKLYFADGTHWVYYDPVTDTVEDWQATAGTLPEDDDGNTPRLICRWRNRIILSGLLGNPNLIFASKVGDATDFDYSDVGTDGAVPADCAWSSTTGPQGAMGDVITGLIPFNDDVMVIGMDSSMALFRGDPLAGGAIDNVTTTIGMAWGEAWAMDPTGRIYFFSNRCGIFTVIPGQLPVRMSQPIDPLIVGTNTGEYVIRMIWNDRFKGLHVFITLLAEEFETEHYFWEEQAKAWWKDVFGNTAHNPLCCLVFDGNNQDDRVALIGSWDGYVRSISTTADDDDGTIIESEVWIGPFLTNLGDSVTLNEVQGILGADSGDVQYAVMVADTAEEALEATPAATGTWVAGRNYTDAVRRAGYAAYIQLSSTVEWAFESIRAKVATRGPVRQRGK